MNDLAELQKKVDFIMKSIKVPVKSKTVGPDGYPRVVQISLDQLYNEAQPRQVKL
jgi:hypothetical protein